MSDAAASSMPPRPRRRVPYIQQLEATDCGAACLAMVLGYWGFDVLVARTREALDVSGSGITGKTILEGAAQFGLVGRGVKVEIDDLHHLPKGSILHWSFGHWIVFERLEPGGVRVVDPAAGRRLIPLRKFRDKFTGVALVLSPGHQFVRRRMRRNLAWQYIRRLFQDRRLLAQVMLLTGLLQVFGMVLPAAMGVVVDRVVPRTDYSLLLVVGVGSLVVVAFSLSASLLRTYLLVQLRTKLDFELASNFIHHLAALPFAFFQRRRTGDLMMRVNSNSRIREFLASTVVSGLLDAVLTVSYLAVVAAISPPMAGLMLLLGAARVLVLLLVHRQLTESMAAQLDASAKAQGYLAELIAGIETLKAAGRELPAVGRWTNLYTEELQEAAHRGRIDGVAHAVLSAMETGSPLAVLGLGALLTMAGEVTLGTMLALVALAHGFLLPLTELVRSGLQLSLLKAYLERVEDVLQTEPEQPPSTERNLLSTRLRGDISLRHVSFRYGANSPLVLDDLSLEIRSGQTIAIVGESGSGKSTLAHLLLGLYLPTSGDIVFDGQSIRGLDLPRLRRQVGVVSQHPYLFAGTVRENITLADDTLPLSRSIAAARAARIHDDVMKLPMRYESQLPDRGESLSGGQRQRIALARAILRRPSILLLDEATSALDARTELEITQSIERLRCTKIIIAHRLSTIARADLIVVMNGGRIAEVGRHKELLARADVYRSLVSAQSELIEEVG